MCERGADGEVQQRAVRLAAIVFAPRALAGEGGEVRAGDMMMVADLAAPQPREIRLGPIRRGSIVRNELGAVIDPVSIVTAVQDIPRRQFVAIRTVPEATRARMVGTAALSRSTTTGMARPLRSRIMTTTWRLPVRSSARRRSRRSALRFAPPGADATAQAEFSQLLNCN